MDMKAYFPEHLANNPQYKVLLETMSIEMDVIAAYIKDFTDLFNADYTPERFLEVLSNDLGYDFTKDHSTLSQREITKRLFEAYKKRGTEVDVKKTLVYGPDQNYFRGDLTYYEGPLSEQEVHLIFPMDHIFIYSKSHLSGPDLISSDVYRAGTIIIQLEEWNSIIRDKLLETIPAGLKWLIERLINIISDDGKIVRFDFYPVGMDYFIQFDIECSNNGNCFILNETPMCSLVPLCGDKIISVNTDIERDYAASFLPPEVLKHNNSDIWTFYPQKKLETISQVSYTDDTYLYNYIPNSISKAIEAYELSSLIENNYQLFNDRPWVNLKIRDVISDINYVVYGFESFCMRKGIKTLSETFILNKQHPLSGIRIGETTEIVGLDGVRPTDFLYPISEIEDHLPLDSENMFWNAPFESYIIE